jgi:hypothetical protein
MGSFGSGDGAFNSYMVDLLVIVSALSLGTKISVRTSSDCEDCSMGRESVKFLQRLLDL